MEKICYRKWFNWLFFIVFIFINDGSNSLSCYSLSIYTQPIDNNPFRDICMLYYGTGKPYIEWDTYLMQNLDFRIPDSENIVEKAKSKPSRKFTFPSYRIMSHGKATSGQLADFLLKCNPRLKEEKVNEIAGLYIEESGKEGVNHDIAFCQMCLETGFLKYEGIVNDTQNNFCGLGTVGKKRQGERFASAEIGIRAHIQHLKAYASHSGLNQPLVDNRFRMVKRGVAPSVHKLSGKWAADKRYGSKISSLLRRLSNQN